MWEAVDSKNRRLVKAEAVIDAIRSGRHEPQITGLRRLYQKVLRETGDEKAAKREIALAKQALPVVAWSGVFKDRGDKNLVKYSHLLCADLDNIPDEATYQELWRKAKDDPHVYAAFRSPSGGMKIVFRVAGGAGEHAGNFRAVRRHVRTHYGVELDPSCRNLERLCFVSYDPEAFTKPALPLAPILDEEPEEAGPSVVVPGSRRQIAEGLLGEIDWHSETSGFCTCPGFHQSCAGIVAGVNYSLRSQIAKAEYADATNHDDGEPAVSAVPWPAPPGQMAYHGLGGEIVNTISPHSEADPAGMLVMFLCAFGNLIGPTAHFEVESMRHYARLFVVLCGETSRGRKGSAWSNVRYFFELTDEDWLRGHVTRGLSSGEGLIFNVRDPVVKPGKDENGNAEEKVIDEGVTDKRLLVIEEELGAVLKRGQREGNTLLDVVRQAWDYGDLRTMTRNAGLTATGAHVSIISHVTKADLGRLLPESDCFNGTANRFLWLAVKRSKLLPRGGNLRSENLNSLVAKLHRAINFARSVMLVKLTDAAEQFWDDLYPVLTEDRPGVWGAVTSRAEAQVKRLALIYAMLDRSPTIGVVHLQAALELWSYCDRSCRYIFGDRIGDRTADRVLGELKSAGARGLTQSDLFGRFKGNVTALQLQGALALLRKLKMATLHPQKNPRGRPTMLWRFCPPSFGPGYPAPRKDEAEPEQPAVKEAVAAPGDNHEVPMEI
jgi:hypothetical protein